MSDDPTPASQEPIPEYNRAAEYALVLGVLSLVGAITTIPGLIAGMMGWRQANRLGGAGRGKAIAGIVMSCVGVVVLVLGYRAVEKVRDASRHSVVTGKLKFLGIAMHNYCDQHGPYPSPFARHPDDPFTPVSESELASKMSWRISIVPYLEHDHLGKNLREPWDSPTNRPLAEYHYRTLMDPETPQDPDTRYRVFYGPGSVFPLNRPAWKMAITDGMSNTLLVIESGEKVTWTRFAEIKFDPNTPPDPTAMGRPKQTTFQATMADGSVRTFRKSMNPQVLWNAITPYGGEVMNFDD